MLQRDWSAVGDQAAPLVWQVLGIAGPVLFATLLLLLVLRAAMRQSRYRIDDTLGEEDRRAVHEAIVAAERRTVGEILPVVVERSDPHPGAEWMAAFVVLLVGSTVLAAWLPWNRPALVLLAQLLLGGLGFGLARWLPDFKRMFVFEDRATKVAQEQAFQEFYGNGLHTTEGATGVLIFVSLLEHRAVILADEGIDCAVDARFWAETDDAILRGIRAGSLRDGLVGGITRAGEKLAECRPWTAGDRNEIPDRLILRRE